jgi:bifunctional DNA-binding transcriptional regulator/antitoxin component of YhaV-PrlF toxin-antitoxin module
LRYEISGAIRLDRGLNSRYSPFQKIEKQEACMLRDKPLAKLVRPLSKGQITLPVEFRRRLKIGAETILNLTLKGGRIEIIPLRPMPQETTLREYERDEVQRFLKEDRLDPRTARKVRRLLGRKRPA